MLIILALATADAPCPVPSGWESWAHPTAHRAAKSPELRFALKAGEAQALTLAPAEQVKLAAPSRHAAKPDQFAGLADIEKLFGRR